MIFSAILKLLRSFLCPGISLVLASLPLQGQSGGSAISSASSSSASEAHEKSRFAVIDPLYDSANLNPPPNVKKDAAPWLYGEAELECWRLHVLRQQVSDAKLKVKYPGTYHTPSPRAVFRLSSGSEQNAPGSLDFRAVGDVIVSVGNREIYRGTASESSRHIAIPSDWAAGKQPLQVALSTKGEAPALLIEDGPLATGSAPWLWSADGKIFEEPQSFPQTLSGEPPHCAPPSDVILKPTDQQDGLFDMGREVFGRIAFSCAGKPALFVGESQAEANNSNPSYFEQSTELQKQRDGTWSSRDPLAFRYFRITGGKVSDVQCLGWYTPAQYRGAFACSDERLTRIWMNSAYTIRLCRQDFLLDGVKRDRLPWAGDLVMSSMANAYTFGDGEVVRRSLVALGRAGIAQTNINGVVDYSMWWVIAQDAYQKYYGDEAHLRREWPRIKDTLDRLAAKSDADGLYQIAPKSWVFIDWVKEDKQTAVQILWWWAQTCGAKLADRLGDGATAAHWRSRAAALKKTLYLRAWDRQAGTWRGLPDGKSGASRPANILAVISGLAEPSQGQTILSALLADKMKPVGTPYMAGFEDIALGRLGASDALLERTNTCWGGMLAQGATTFWEAWDPSKLGNEAYRFYKRPFGKSLCHAWSGGPAAFLPSEICGLRPLSDGWARFTVDPQLGALQWACATVPTPHGAIEISLEHGHATLQIPAGTSAEWQGKTMAGPGFFKLDQ
jgi:hypothetical protein